MGLRGGRELRWRIGKAPGFSPGPLVKVGVHLLSRNRSTIGRYGLTSVFGMGTGVSRNVITPPLPFAALRRQMTEISRHRD